MRRHRRAALILAAGLALGACGGGGGERGDRTTDVVVDEESGEGGVVIEDRLVAAAASSMDAGSARMAMTMTMAVPGMDDVVVSAEGVTDFTSGDSQMTMDMGPLMQGLASVGLDGLGEDLVVEVRVVDGVVYMRYPEALSQFMGGAPWLAVDASDALAASGTNGPFGQADPTQYLEYLAAVSSGVQEVSRETVRDVETTRYHAVIDFEKAMDQVPPEALESLGIDAHEFAEQLAQMREVLGSEMPADVWIDDDGLLRRMRMDMSVAAQSMSVDLEMYDYGVDVQVEAPPADEVSDLSELLGGLGSGFGVGEDPT